MVFSHGVRLAFRALQVVSQSTGDHMHKNAQKFTTIYLHLELQTSTLNNTEYLYLEHCATIHNNMPSFGTTELHMKQ